MPLMVNECIQAVLDSFKKQAMDNYKIRSYCNDWYENFQERKNSNKKKFVEEWRNDGEAKKHKADNQVGGETLSS